MITPTDGTYNPLAQIIGEVLRRSRRPREVGKNANARARSVGQWEGYLEGSGDAIAILLTAMRAERFAGMQFVPVVEGHEVFKDLIEPLTALRDEHDFQVTRASSSEKSVLREKQDKMFEEIATKLISKIAYPEELVDQAFVAHKKAVLEGKEDPRPEDIKWLSEDIDKKRAAMEELFRLAEEAKKAGA